MNKKSLKEYRIWKAMKARCYAPSQTKGYYKQNNISVCERWRDSFANFIEDMGPIPSSEYSIERIDVSKGYTPSNCKWIRMKDQPKNRSNTIWVNWQGQKICLKDLTRKIGVKYGTLYMKYRRAGNDLKAVDAAIREYYGMSNNKEEE